IGCCDDSLEKHSRKHAAETGHTVIRSFEPGEVWFYDFSNDDFYESGPALAPPENHPLDQPTPGPAGRVPADWRRKVGAWLGPGSARLAHMEGIERGVLKIMPIHAVTEVYGEGGLRMLFEIESEAFPDAERTDLLRAERVATRLHAADKR